MCLLLVLKVREMHDNRSPHFVSATCAWCALNRQKNSGRAVSVVFGSFAYVRAKVLIWNTGINERYFMRMHSHN